MSGPAGRSMSGPAGPAGPTGPGGSLEAAVEQADQSLEVSTGHPAIDASLRAVAQVAGHPPADQIPAYQAAHRTLREILASIDES